LERSSIDLNNSLTRKAAPRSGFSALATKDARSESRLRWQDAVLIVFEQAGRFEQIENQHLD
jgi:hypothetical protein